MEEDRLGEKTAPSGVLGEGVEATGSLHSPLGIQDEEQDKPQSHEGLQKEDRDK